MAKNDFKPFASGENANVLTQAEYEALEAVGSGFQSGIARSEQLNKVWRQSSAVAATLGSFIADKSGDDVLDDGDLKKLQTSLIKALLNNSTSQLDGRYLNVAKNLSDLSDATKARQSLGLKGAAIQDVGTTTGTVAAGNDSRIVNALQRGNNLSDVTDKVVALNNINGVAKTVTVNGHALNGNINVNSQDIFNGQSISIGANQNLDNYQTPGVYYQPANANTSAALKYPENLAGSLLVLKSAGVTQIYSVYNSSRIWTRGKYADGAWTAWAREYNTLNKPGASDVDAVSATNGGAFKNYVTFEQPVTISNNYPGIIFRDTDMLDGVGKRIYLEQNNGSLYIASRKDDASTTGQTTLIFPRVSGTLYSTGNKPSAGDVGALPLGGGTLTGQVNLPTTGNGAYDNQYGSGAPLMQTATKNETSSTYWPITKQRISITGAKQYAYAISTGTLTSSAQQPSWQVHIKGSAGQSYLLSFSAENGGRLTVPEQMIPGNYGNFDNRYQAKGSYTPAGQAYTKAESDSRYVRDIRQSSTVYLDASENSGKKLTPNGAVFIGSQVNGKWDNNEGFYYSYIQKNINGTWYTISRV